MANNPNSNGSRFGLISGLIGLSLCAAQTWKGHIDARNERERLQEMHEQKMHFLHESHRQQLHHKDSEIRAKGLEVEMRDHVLGRKEMELEGHWHRFGVREGGREKDRDRDGDNGKVGVEEERRRVYAEAVGGAAAVEADGKGAEDGRVGMEKEVWKLMGAGREADEGGDVVTGKEDP
ncbi:hypothetical protein LTR37_016684 [Vermiconidia calcicola]|uniref:Uncharacterized protein n=1 Tax=Vermiconidia calcicola TaxID=1690605 RepID=A0ACC3MM80_9PEZI|nr:hypothetical protein LTR37_016684 [Vermiconidia calcicola]